MRRILTVVAAASTLAVATAAMSTDADARWRGHRGGSIAAGVIVGVIGGLAAGVIGGLFAGVLIGDAFDSP